MQIAPPADTTPRSPRAPSIGELALFAIAPFALIYAISAPTVAAAALVATALLLLTIRSVGPRIAFRLQDETRTLNVPAFGTIEFRITPK